MWVNKILTAAKISKPVRIGYITDKYQLYKKTIAGFEFIFQSPQSG